MNKLPKDVSIYSVAPSISNLEPLTLPLAFTTPATSNLPNEPVEVAEPLTFPGANIAPLSITRPLASTILPNEPVLVELPLITLLAPVVIILPVAVKSSYVISPVKVVDPLTISEPVTVKSYALI